MFAKKSFINYDKNNLNFNLKLFFYKIVVKILLFNIFNFQIFFWNY